MPWFRRQKNLDMKRLHESTLLVRAPYLHVSDQHFAILRFSDISASCLYQDAANLEAAFFQLLPDCSLYGASAWTRSFGLNEQYPQVC